MKILKAIKSTFEAVGITVFIYFFYVYLEKPEEFLVKEALIAFGVAVLLVWIMNKTLRWQGKHNELEECPYCGAELDFEEVLNTNHSAIQRLDVDGMGKFLMDWGLACCRNEEPQDVFKWLEEEEWTDEE